MMAEVVVERGGDGMGGPRASSHSKELHAQSGK